MLIGIFSAFEMRFFLHETLDTRIFAPNYHRKIY